MTGRSQVRLHVATCPPCDGKRLYANRRTAKAIAKQMPGTHVTAYRCRNGSNGWHLGHLPRDIVQGLGSKQRFEEAVDRRRRRST